jgi:hypothetical protein
MGLLVGVGGGFGGAAGINALGNVLATGTDILSMSM